MCPVDEKNVTGNKETSHTSGQEDLKKIVKEHIHSIKKNILFQDFPLNGLVKFLITCKQDRHEAGDVLFSEDEPSTSMAIVLKGTVSISKEGSKICDLQPPALIGEIGLFTEEPRNATVRVLDDVISLTITQKDLNTFINKEPKLSITLYRNIAFCLRNKINNDNRLIMSLQEENSKLKEGLEQKELSGNDSLDSKEKKDSLSLESDASSKDRANIRVAISNKNVCHIKIEKETYDLKDLSLGGINIETSQECWLEGDVLIGEIVFKDEPPFPFAGTVRSAAGDTYGIQFNRVPLNLESVIIKTVNFLQRLGAVI